MIEFNGQVCALQDSDKLNLVCRVKSAKKKILVLNTKGREQSVTQNKLIWDLNKKVSSPDEWLKCVDQIEQNISSNIEEIDIELLWDAAAESNTSDLDQLSSLYFGETDVLKKIAIWRILEQDHLYFKRKGLEWEHRSEEQIQKLRLQRQVSEANMKTRRIAEEWMCLAMEGINSNRAIEVTAETTPFVLKLKKWLFGNIDKDVMELLNKHGRHYGQIRELAFDILLLAKMIPDDSNRDIIVEGLTESFSDDLLEFAEKIPSFKPDPESSIQKFDFSIDDEETREVDDALSITKNSDGWLIRVAIASPSEFVKNSDIIDSEALKRGTTVYLPSKVILMLPENISCNIASLNVNQPCPAVVTQFQINDSGEISDFDITCETIMVERQLTYDQVDEMLVKGSDECSQKLCTLSALAQKLKQKRIENGALDFDRPEYKIKIDENRIVTIAMLSKRSLSRTLVSEMMIQTNHLTACYAQNKDIPIIYRGQEAPEQQITPEILATPLGFHSIRRYIRPSKLSLTPSFHSGLGLDSYTQATSPLRRYADLAMQRQLIANITGKPSPYDQQELFKILATAEESSKDAAYAERRAKKRWFLVYLQQQPRNSIYKALIVDEIRGGYKIELQPWGVDAILNANNMEKGEYVQVKCLSLDLKNLKATMALE